MTDELRALEDSKRTIWDASSLYLRTLRMMSPELRAELGIVLAEEELRVVQQAERWASHANVLIDDMVSGDGV